jgi:hypothetical protein
MKGVVIQLPKNALPKLRIRIAAEKRHYHRQSGPFPVTRFLERAG